MDNKLVNHLSVTIEKVSYLFRNVRRGDGTIKKLEMALLKQYVMDLYEGLLELEKTAPKLNLDEMIDNIAKQPQISKDELQNQAPVVVAMPTEPPPPPPPPTIEPIPAAVEQYTPTPQKNNQEEADNFDFLNQDPKTNNAPSNKEDEDDTTGKKPKQVAEQTQDSSANIWDFIKNKSQQVKNQLNTIEDKIEDKWEKIEDKIEDKWEKIEDKIEDKWEATKDKIEDKWETTIEQSQDENATVKMDRQISEPLEIPQDFKKTAKTQVLDDLVKSHAFDEWNTPDNRTILPSTHTQEEATIAMQNIPQNQQTTTPKNNNDPSGLAYFNIGINDKMRFVNELFNGNANEFTTHLNELAKAKGYIEALTHINLNVRYDFNWKEDDPTAKEFLEIIKTKFWS